MRVRTIYSALGAMLLTPAFAFAQAPRFDLNVGAAGEAIQISGAVGMVLMMGLLALLPSLVMMMTAYPRFIIVLHLLRQAIGTQTAPPTMLLGSLALLLTGYVMSPVLEEANRTALQPYMEGQMTQAEAMKAASAPFHAFMYEHTRSDDVARFLEMNGRDPDLADRPAEVPLLVLTSAFITSELKTAFFLGFAVFLPFLIIDMIVAAVLVALGAFMLPPQIVSLPVKLLVFVLADGWFLLVSSLVQGYH